MANNDDLLGLDVFLDSESISRDFFFFWLYEPQSKYKKQASQKSVVKTVSYCLTFWYSLNWEVTDDAKVTEGCLYI